MENLSDYLVKNPKQLLLHLKTLATEKCLIAAKFGENQSFLTAILEIDEKSQLITIDCGPKEYLNKELLNLGIVSCSADFNGIKVLFEGRGIKKAGTAGQMALSLKFPEQLFWIQRRQYYRVRSPLSKNSYCVIELPETESTEKNSEKKRTLLLKLFDLSATGIALLSDSKEAINQISINTTYTNCKLILDDTELLTISLIIRSLGPLNPNQAKKSQRIGCEILNSTPRTESTLIRYMQNIERQIKKNFD